jgi:HEAT repeat protein
MNLGARAVPPLVAALESRRSAARLRAARVLGAIGDERAVRPLKKLLRTEKNGDVREVVAEALTELAKTD